MLNSAAGVMLPPSKKPPPISTISLSRPAISGAFIATLYGVASANVVFLPVASKLRGISEAELALRELTIEGVLAIQAGDNPRIVADKLIAFVPPEDRQSAQAEAAPAARKAPEPDPAQVPA